MKPMFATRLTLSLLGLAIAASISAQPATTEFPAERSKPATCDDFGWNADMTRDHPRIVDACQETVSADGTTWARLSARFVKVQNDGLVVFTIRDKRDRVVEEVTMEPGPGQVAYINDRATEFDQLSTTDALNLYVPEGEYGYATQPIPKQRFTRIAPVTPVVATAPAPREVEEVAEPPQQQIAMSDDEPPAMLPKTASLMPWALFAGGLLLFTALTLKLRRKL